MTHGWERSLCVRRLMAFEKALSDLSFIGPFPISLSSLHFSQPGFHNYLSQCPVTAEASRVRPNDTAP